MYINKNQSQANKYMESDGPIRPVQLPCRFHTGSICLNYCHQISCCKLLCEECIQQHLDHHKKNGLPILSIKSFKKVRQFCVQRLNRLIDDLMGRMSTLKQPKNPQQILQQANMKFEAIKKLMFEIIEQQLNKFYQQMRIKVNQSFSTLKNLEEVHENLTKIILQLKQSKGIIVEGTKEIPETVQKVLGMKESIYIDTFSREAVGYAQKLAYVDFDVSMNQNKFRNAVNQSLRIQRNQHEQIANNSADFGLSRMNLMKTQNATPSNRSRIRQSDQLQISQTGDLKYLHFFQTGSSFLHLIDLSSPSSIHKQTIQLPNNYIVPFFHASIMFPQGYVFISGGNVQVGGNQIKWDKLSKYSMKAKSGENFKKDFAKVKPRSSHSICEVGQYLYILGGYGQVLNNDIVESQKTVQKVNIRNGEVQVQSKSKYGGANISIALNNTIVKASQQGVQIYNTLIKKWTTIQIPSDYNFIRGCGWSRVSKDTLLVYGGYNENQDGIDICKQWVILDNQVTIKNTNFRLPYKQGFLNNPGIVVNGNVYALQNVSVEESRNEESVSGVEESQRALLVFDGNGWRQTLI